MLVSPPLKDQCILSTSLIPMILGSLYIVLVDSRGTGVVVEALEKDEVRGGRGSRRTLLATRPLIAQLVSSISSHWLTASDPVAMIQIIYTGWIASLQIAQVIHAQLIRHLISL